MMGCKCAISYDPDTNRYECSVSGDSCMFMLPDSKECAERYGEGPDAEDGEPKMTPAKLTDIQARAAIAFDICKNDERLALVYVGQVTKHDIPGMLSHISELTGKAGQLETKNKKLIEKLEELETDKKEQLELVETAQLIKQIRNFYQMDMYTVNKVWVVMLYDPSDCANDQTNCIGQWDSESLLTALSLTWEWVKEVLEDG